MKLFIIPGGGDPAAKAYKEGFDLIKSEAEKRGYDEVFIFKFPGHFSLTASGAVLNQQTAAQKVARKLARAELTGIPYTIFARSYGCGVAMRVLLKNQLPNLRHILLWGPTPAVGIYKVTAFDKAKIMQARKEKGCYVDVSSYDSCIPLDIQLLEYSGKHTVHLAAGTQDEHCRKTYFLFLKDYLGDRNNLTYSRVPGLKHEVTRYNRQYLELVFGTNV